MDHGDIERQAQEMQFAGMQNRELTIRKMMRTLDVERELAEYLLRLEARIDRLEQDRPGTP